ncbi:MAG: hypothetical protein QGF53_16305 [Alphaproteobacteria bacterium]|jgi:hypothetical protein|nr:hypothetical protein [Alphaproteobacteria bacterium]
MRFLFATVIWGKQYVDDFLAHSLPTQLAVGNLGDFPWAEGSAYLIMTTAEDKARLEASPLMRRLKRIMTVIYGDLSEIPLHNKYIGASMAQQEALKRAADYDAIFFVYPDFICATGTIQYSAQKIIEGWDAVMFPVPAVLDTIFSDPAIRDSEVVTPSIDGDIIAIPPRLLVEASMRNCHPMISGYFMGGQEKHNIGPAYMIWDVPECGWLFRCFHLHPFVIRVDRDNPYFLTEFIVSLDEEYVPRLFRSTDRIHFPECSDDFAMCSLREQDSQPQPVDGPVRLDPIIYWAEEYASLVHRDFILRSFIWTPRSRHDVGAPEAWFEAIQKSNRTAEIIRERLNTPDSVLRFENDMAYSARTRRRRRFDKWRSPVFHEFAPHETAARPTAQPPDEKVPADSILGALMRLKQSTGLYKLRRFPILLNAWLWLKTVLR